MGENRDRKDPNFSEFAKEEEPDKKLNNEDLDDVSGGVVAVATCGNCGKTLDKCQCQGLGAL